MNDENTMTEHVVNWDVLKKIQGLKDNYISNHKEIYKITRIHNKQIGLREFNTQRTYCRKEKQREAYITSLHEWIID